MAKAVFQRNQKVWVESVGCWATVEKVVPIWTKGFDEPVRVTYDVGLGRDFQAHELRAEDPVAKAAKGVDPGSGWRLLRAHNKWQQPADTPHHPFPGTYPIVVTDTQDWGGWRVPGAEYDRDPRKIEQQARLIARAPALRALARELIELVSEAPEDVPAPVLAIARRAAVLERQILEAPAVAAAPRAAAAGRA